MLPILAIISLTFAQTERPPKLDFKEKIDYAAWINDLLPPLKGENAMDRYAAFVSTSDGKGGMSPGIPDIEGVSKEQLDALDGSWTPAQYPDLAKYIERNSKYLDALIHATQVRDFRDPVKPGSLVVEHLLPYYGPSRWACRALLARAWMKQPNQSKALEEAHRSVFVARRHLQQTPFLICGLAGLAEGSLVYGSVRLALDENIITEKDCARWFQEIQREDPGTATFNLYVREEWASCLNAIQRTCPGGKHNAEGWVWANEMTGFGKPLTAKEYAAFTKVDPRESVAMLDAHFEALLAVAEGPLRWSKADQFRKLSEKFQSKVKETSNYVAGLFVPEFSRAYQLSVRVEAERRGTLLTLAIHAHHATHGKWPEDLGKIDAKLGLNGLKALRVDPFSGKRFMYRMKDGKPVLYSVGADGDDDGGTHHPKFGENGEGGDYVFWPRQPK